MRDNEPEQSDRVFQFVSTTVTVMKLLVLLLLAFLVVGSVKHVRHLNPRPWERVYVESDYVRTCVHWTGFEMPKNDTPRRWKMRVVVSGFNVAGEECRGIRRTRLTECMSDTATGKVCMRGNRLAVEDVYFPFFPNPKILIRVRKEPLSLVFGNENCLLTGEESGEVFVERGYYFRRLHEEETAPVSRDYRSAVLDTYGSFVPVPSMSTVCGDHLVFQGVKLIFRYQHFDVTERFYARVTGPRCDVRGGLHVAKATSLSDDSGRLTVSIIPDDREYSYVDVVRWPVKRRQKYSYIDDSDLWRMDDVRYVYACGVSFPFLNHSMVEVTITLPKNCSDLYFFSLCGGFPLFDSKVFHLEEDSDYNVLETDPDFMFLNEAEEKEPHAVVSSSSNFAVTTTLFFLLLL